MCSVIIMFIILKNYFWTKQVTQKLIYYSYHVFNLTRNTLCEVNQSNCLGRCMSLLSKKQPVENGIPFPTACKTDWRHVGMQYIHTHIFRYVYVCMCIHMYVYMHVWVHVCTHAYTHLSLSPVQIKMKSVYLSPLHQTLCLIMLFSFYMSLT